MLGEVIKRKAAVEAQETLYYDGGRGLFRGVTVKGRDTDGETIFCKRINGANLNSNHKFLNTLKDKRVDKRVEKAKKKAQKIADKLNKKEGL
jgi:hypothetical protein